MEFALEMVLRARLAGLHMTEVPITLWPDGRSRPPHLKTWTDGWRSLRLFLLFSPRWLFFYPGLTLLLGGLVLSSILVFGPVRITPRFGLDLHALLLSAMATIVGIQSISFAVIARRYAAARGFLPLNPHLEARAGWFKLEQVIVVALALGVAGVGGIIWGFTRWAAVDFGPVQFGAVTRGLIVSATLAVIALQLTFTAFFAALLDIPSRDQER
jgi:hypothetical protein